MLNQSNKRLLSLFLFLAIIGRLLIHPANVTPFINISLCVGQKFSKWVAVLTIIFGFIISDVLLSFVYHYPIFGNWTLFTYSGYIFIILLSRKLNLEKCQNYLMFLFSVSIGFWLWTNFGSWLYMPVYPKTLTGSIYCYSVALPFLRNQLFGDILWFGVIAVSQKHILKNLVIKKANSNV